MGKRKASKTAKKKQAKAASRAKARNQTAAFGVTVVKGSKGRSRQDNNNNNNSSFAGRNNAQVKVVRKAGKPRSTAFGSKKFTASSDQNRARQQHQRATASPNAKEERQDFDRAYASLQERADVRQQQKCGGGFGKRRNKKSGKQQQGASSLFSNLDDPSIKLGPETLGEMVDDAADRVAAGMSDIGQQISPFGKMPSAPPNTPSVPRAIFNADAHKPQAAAAPAEGQDHTNLLQVLAAKKREEWAAQKYMLQPESKPQDKNDSMGDNRYAFLDNGDSDEDDNGWGDDGSVQETAPAFQFAPPSFSAGGSSFGEVNATANTGAGDVEDVDPDL